MQSVLAAFLGTQVLAFILTFTRLGSAMMIMPGLGDSFMPARIRLHIALGLTLVFMPVVQQFMPDPVPSGMALIALIASELVIGLLIGTVARIFTTALDTAGMIISTQSGLANAQVFNPSLSAQGSIIGAFLSITGVIFLFATNIHHLLIMGIMESYQTFPITQGIPESGTMAELISRAVSSSFSIGVKMAMPFIVMTLIMYIGMGVLARLMPQIQVIQVALPLQILMSIVLLMIVGSALFYFWIEEYETAMIYIFSNGTVPR